jgi:hypothetical protein
MTPGAALIQSRTAPTAEMWERERESMIFDLSRSTMAQSVAFSTARIMPSMVKGHPGPNPAPVNSEKPIETPHRVSLKLLNECAVANSFSSSSTKLPIEKCRIIHVQFIVQAIVAAISMADSQPRSLKN